MTLLSFEESSARRRRLRRLRPVRALQTLLALWQARVALARITRRKRGALREIPAYLRRDLGFPEIEDRRFVHREVSTLAFMWLK